MSAFLAVIVVIALALLIVVTVILGVPWLMPALQPLLRTFDRYCDWVESKQR